MRTVGGTCPGVMADTPAWAVAGRTHVWLPYTTLQSAAPALPVVRTLGTRIILADGSELIDGVGSWWTACHGYNHTYIAQAVREQLERMPHVMFGGLAHEPGYTLATRLAQLIPALPHVFFSDSGSVAVEVAMKMATQYWMNTGVVGRTRFLSFFGGYHGDTFGAMSVCDPAEGMHTLFAGILPRQIIVPLPTDEASTDAFRACLAAHAHELAAVIVEPLVQGAGGMIFHEPAVLNTLRDVCDAHDVLLIFDEIFVGFGRTGSMFAAEQAGIAPDLMTLSKALTAGTMPLAATLASPRVHEAFWSDQPARALMHGPTYMANPLACAAACASLDLFERHDRLAEVAAIEAGLRAGLAPCGDLPNVRDVRVRGAIGVVELNRLRDLPTLKAAFVAAGAWVRPLGSAIYLTPAFTMDAEELAHLTNAVYTVLSTATEGLG